MRQDIQGSTAFYRLDDPFRIIAPKHEAMSTRRLHENYWGFRKGGGLCIFSLLGVGGVFLGERGRYFSD